MGWIIAIVIIVFTAISGQSADANSAMITAGLFGIAGAISSVAMQISKIIEKKDENKQNEEM